VPTPASHFGYTPGDDYKTADTIEAFAYSKELAAASGRIRLVEFGRRSEGRPIYVAFISAKENLRKLGRPRQINARLALGQAAAEEARALSEGGRAVIWIDFPVRPLLLKLRSHTPPEYPATRPHFRPVRSKPVSWTISIHDGVPGRRSGRFRNLTAGRTLFHICWRSRRPAID
jgi:hypothetical protein